MARYTVKDNSTGKRLKSVSLDKAAGKADLDPSEVEWAVSEHGRADGPNHVITQQSKGRPSFAFR